MKSSLRAQTENTTSNAAYNTAAEEYAKSNQENSKPAPTRAQRPDRNKAADAYVNLYVVDANGNKHRLPGVMPLHKGLGRKLDDALIGKLENTVDGEEVTFEFVGEIVLANAKADPVF